MDTLVFQPVEHIGTDKRSILYKGLSGVGKTHNALTWPGKKLLLYFDRNMETINTFIDGGADLERYEPKDWKEIDTQFIPAIEHRELKCETIILDTLDTFSQWLAGETEGPGGKMNIDLWGKLKRRHRALFSALASSIQFREGLPNYNFVCTTHVQDFTDGNGDTILARRQPKTEGGFREEVEGMFDTVLLCQSEVKTKMDKGRKVGAEKLYFCHSVAPTSLDSCKSKGLPARVGGTYPELLDAWKGDKK